MTDYNIIAAEYCGSFSAGKTYEHRGDSDAHTAGWTLVNPVWTVFVLFMLK